MIVGHGRLAFIRHPVEPDHDRGRVIALCRPPDGGRRGPHSHLLAESQDGREEQGLVAVILERNRSTACWVAGNAGDPRSHRPRIPFRVPLVLGGVGICLALRGPLIVRRGLVGGERLRGCQRGRVGRIDHAAALDQEAAQVDGQDHHPEDGNHRQRHDEQRGAALVIRVDPVEDPAHSHSNTPLIWTAGCQAGRKGMEIEKVWSQLTAIGCPTVWSLQGGSPAGPPFTLMAGVWLRS